jgi:hypothetical protein
VSTTPYLEPAIGAIADIRRAELEKDARAVIGECSYFTAANLEALTGTRASTWRYWASRGLGPPSHTLGRRRIWARAATIRWLVEQEQAVTNRD